MAASRTDQAAAGLSGTGEIPIAELAHQEWQRALRLYGILGPVGGSVADAIKPIAFHKPTELIIGVSELGVVARRALNACYFLAQPDPFAAEHAVDLQFFRWLIEYRSKNSAHLKQVIHEAQRASILVNVHETEDPDDKQRISVPTLGEVGIRAGRLIFNIPERLRIALAANTRRATLSMGSQARFSSPYALALYEHLSAYRGDGQTPYWTVDELRNCFGGEQSAKPKEYRYFNRDIVRPAVERINALADIRASMKVRRAGRSVTHVKFIVKPRIDGKKRGRRFGEGI
jgi:hypothetical protein